MSWKPLFTSKTLSRQKKELIALASFENGFGEGVHSESPNEQKFSVTPARPTQEWEGWIIPSGMLYSGNQRLRGYFLNGNLCSRLDFETHRPFAVYRPSSNESANKATHLLLFLSYTFTFLGAWIPRVSTWFPPETLCSACRVQETLFLKDFNKKSNLFSALTRSDTVSAIIADTLFEANRYRVR